MEARASAKYLRGSAQKARLVVDMIRGKNVGAALAILKYSNKRAGKGIEKCVRSAIANANEAAEKANISIDPDDLWVKTAFVDRGPTKNRRRVRPAPQGRAFRERRHFCHITILLSSDEQVADKKVKGNGKTEAGKKAAAPAESKAKKRGGAASAPRAKRVAPGSKEGSKAAEKQDASAAKKSAKADDKAPAKKATKKPEASTTEAAKEDSSE
ncbi:MAG: large subunit ribosomal protein [Blastocatellia bacterium]|jgi:large subunit ribosomal protein L22|nr:large subunit ribosomal protein [Blastocatellia bacterium]